MKIYKFAFATVSLMLLVLPGNITAHQGVNSAPQIQTQKTDDNPLYRITVNVVAKSTVAINYRNRSGATNIDFKGTPLFPKAKGEAKVEAKKGYTEIDVKFSDLQPATRFGPEYLTYVLWAISPEGRAANLGEILLDGNNGQLEVTSDLQAFGLIVTAEPYFAVTQPSDVVVMENQVRSNTRGNIETVNAKYELLQRGQYATNVPPADLKPLPLDKKTPLDLYQAQNAVRIARWAGADKYAADTFDKAQKLLVQAEEDKKLKETKPLIMSARQAAQTAEDARIITLKRQEDNRISEERAAAAAREADARTRAEQAALQQQVEAQRRALAESDEVAARAAADAAERNRVQAQVEAQRSAQDAQRAAIERQNAEAAANQARQQASKAEHEKQELRQQLNQQLNAVLQTHDTPRGLVVNMSDVVFDTGAYTLKPAAKEKLAKISGIVQAHQGLRLEVEGFTDNVGSEETNRVLSEKRAEAVRQYLMQQGVNPSTITAHGFGEDRPVASNDTSSGRQMNRRVEMIVSGDIIGGRISLTSELQR
jgi:outer membrane protein OmpA-like peptidoglycan-associated protein